ncbi:aspartate dehydrogenase [Bradyrhizobium lablabi]|uniref:aspartate dehydrogenase n=1 Tax=Bradyrhizobium lablabi TaxID=722472 RepID=UPI001BAB21B5|nr:aspartate dehydrogenase [Bradyrhizobium lablabi]MBR1124888.1 aspartate dehydrogenase [Bradyrhizobium lablabi]
MSTGARRIGLVGFGAIGKDVATRLLSASDPPHLTILTRKPIPATAGIDWVGSVFDLIDKAPDIVIEAAGHAAVRECVPPLLEDGIPVVLTSVGALADDALEASVRHAEKRGQSGLILPGGAIGGIDYLRSVAQLPDVAARYCSRKPVAAWRQEIAALGLDPDAATSEIVLFEGSARKAALLFPQNLNVALTIALAVGGMNALQVRVVADPRVKRNSHEIEIESSAGRASFVFENTPSAANPKTSAVTALSIVQAVKERLDVIRPRKGME